MKIFHDNGYVNIGGILNEGFPFNFIVGARATGKTVDALNDSVEKDEKFLYMRRTQSQCDLISKPDFSPFKPINEIFHREVKVKTISKYNSMFYTELQDSIKIHGYTAALSTIANMRGFSASDITRLIYDEFIGEEHEKPIKHEAEAVLNAYETINRNRELEGKPALQLAALANSNRIDNPLFEELGLIRIADKLQKSGAMRWTDEKRGIQLIMLSNSPISQKKRGTALYRLTDNSDFSRMALDNSFNINRQHVRPRPITEYVPVCSIGELFIYRHKNDIRLYGTTYKTGVFNKTFTLSETDKLRYHRFYMHHWDMYIEGNIDFEDVLAETLFLKYWNE